MPSPTTNPSVPQRTGSRIPWLVGLLLVLAMGAAGCASSSDGSTGEGAKGTGEPFAFTDDRGETVELDKPTDIRVVAQEDAAVALMHLGIKPVGIFGGQPMDTNPLLEDLDLSGIESLGEAWGQIKMEKLAALQPDLIISTFYTGEDGVLFEGGVYGFGTEKQQGDAQELAPIIAIDATQPSSQAISRFSELAATLGADVESGEVAEERADFEAAVEDLKAAAAESGASVLAVTPATDGMYVAVPDAFADTRDLVDWGVNMMTPDGDLVSSYYELLSWENAAKYQPDVVLVDDRGYTLSADQLAEEQPTWTDIDAAAAGRVGYWSRITLDYADYTEHVTQLTELLKATDGS